MEKQITEEFFSQKLFVIADDVEKDCKKLFQFLLYNAIRKIPKKKLSATCIVDEIVNHLPPRQMKGNVSFPVVYNAGPNNIHHTTQIAEFVLSHLLENEEICCSLKEILKKYDFF